MRVLLAAVLAGCTLAAAVGATPAQAVPRDCPPICDRIPASAWIDPAAIPLAPVYRWPGLAGIAVVSTPARWKFEEACVSPPITDDRSHAVAAKAVVPQPAGQWQLQAQVAHWRGETWRGGQLATATLAGATAALRSCQLTAPLTSPSITTDLPDRVAAVISVGGGWVLHTYLLAQVRNSTVVELSMWSNTPPLVPWAAPTDQEIFDSMSAPLCTAYIDSCR